MSLRSDIVTVLCPNTVWEEVHNRLTKIENPYTPDAVELYLDGPDGPCLFTLRVYYASESQAMPLGEWIMAVLADMHPTIVAHERTFTYPAGTPPRALASLSSLWGAFEATRMMLSDADNADAPKLVMACENAFETIHRQVWETFG